MRGKSLALAAVGLFSLATWVGASEARAGEDFERGFKNELGRIAAREVVHAGRHLVGGILFRPRAARSADYRVYRYRGNGYAPRDWRPGPESRRRVVREYYYYGEPCERGETRRRRGYYRD